MLVLLLIQSEPIEYLGVAEDSVATMIGVKENHLGSRSFILGDRSSETSTGDRPFFRWGEIPSWNHRTLKWWKWIKL
ncbi:hypothetical protein QUB63_11055 [Microcoleus sp. ARI1-B5]|uniref:hypothetical protein n=1 Tax=unclassified Microcoleus TaxID=2642155 RepID=UPI002FD255FF